MTPANDILEDESNNSPRYVVHGRGRRNHASAGKDDRETGVSRVEKKEAKLTASILT